MMPEEKNICNRVALKKTLNKQATKHHGKHPSSKRDSIQMRSDLIGSALVLWSLPLLEFLTTT
jgi:hypothetical protein